METRRTTSVQARTICEVNVLVQEVFEEILRESPEFAEEMKNLVTERKLHNAKRKNHRDSQKEDAGEQSVSRKVSERSERALMKTIILATNSSKWLQNIMATSTNKLTHAILWNSRSFCSCFIKNAPRFAWRCSISPVLVWAPPNLGSKLRWSTQLSLGS